MTPLAQRFAALLRRPAAAFSLLMLLLACAAHAQPQQPDPPGRVASVTVMQGSIVYAPDGEDEWMQLPLNRPLTRGDRLWTDQGARAELHMGTAVLHIASQSNLALYELDDDTAQISLTQGSVNMRVRELDRSENIEIDTPQLAFRALQPGDYRVDVDPAAGTTRVLVRSGEAQVFGERGESLRLFTGQQAVFAGRDLQQLRGGPAGFDALDQWAAQRNRAEDASISARYLPRGVIGYSQLDAYGTWDMDPGYGAVWYPRLTVQNWAPYREGRWMYIRPWGWTWVDAEPWGFAPFHYGRWALIGSRWAWVPGRIGPRPIYAPALVGFVGGSGASVSIQIGSGPGIGWYPLAPGEAWWPTYRTSSVYITNVNRYIPVRPREQGVHVHRSRPDAVTAVRVEDFNRGRPVREVWRPLRQDDIARAPTLTELPRPVREQGGRPAGPVGLQGPPPSATLPVVPGRALPALGGTAPRREERRVEERRVEEERQVPRGIPNQQQERVQREQAVREQQERMQQERVQQERVQREQAVREQAVRQQQERVQRELAAREQQERVQREQEQRQLREQRDQAQRQQHAREQQEQAARQQERARAEQQQERARAEQDREQREQQRRQQDQQRLQREQERMQRLQRAPEQDRERAPRVGVEPRQSQQQQQQPQQSPQPPAPAQPEREGEPRGRAQRLERPGGQAPAPVAPAERDERPRHFQRAN